MELICVWGLTGAIAEVHMCVCMCVAMHTFYVSTESRLLSLTSTCLIQLLQLAWVISKLTCGELTLRIFICKTKHSPLTRVYKFQPARLAVTVKTSASFDRLEDAGRGELCMSVTSLHLTAVSQTSHEQRFELKEVAPSTRVMTSWSQLLLRPLSLQEGVVRGMASMYTGMCSAKQHAQAWRPGDVVGVRTEG